MKPEEVAKRTPFEDLTQFSQIEELFWKTKRAERFGSKTN